ncbi:MAG: hypothetical protein ACI82Q_000588 [Nonlabens sp.]|jgi:hypothetical protein
MTPYVPTNPTTVAINELGLYWNRTKKDINHSATAYINRTSSASGFSAAGGYVHYQIRSFKAFIKVFPVNSLSTAINDYTRYLGSINFPATPPTPADIAIMKSKIDDIEVKLTRRCNYAIPWLTGSYSNYSKISHNTKEYIHVWRHVTHIPQHQVIRKPYRYGASGRSRAARRQDNQYDEQQQLIKNSSLIESAQSELLKLGNLVLLVKQYILGQLRNSYLPYEVAPVSNVQIQFNGAGNTPIYVNYEPIGIPL